MRILLISGEFPPMQGGVGDYTREMARAFVRAGHQVWVLVPRSCCVIVQSTLPQVTILACARGCPLDKSAGAVQQRLNLREDERSAEGTWQVLPLIRNWGWGCWGEVIRVIREVKPDVVDIQYQAAAYNMRNPAINLLPWRLRRLESRPLVVVTFHDLLPPYLFPKAGPLRQRAVRWLAEYGDAAIVTNAEDWALAQTWPGVNLFQIPIGSNIPVNPPDGFDRETWRASHGYAANDFVWAYFGFLSASKGGETLIRALALADAQTRLLMIGGRVGSSDPTNRAYAERIERLIDELGLQERVRWTGYMSPREVSAALLGVDALVLPYRDGISFRRGSLHAALAHGCAVVSTTPRVSLPELCQGENVLLVPPDDAPALYQAVEAVRRDAGLRTRLGEGARVLAQQFTWDEIARRTVEEVFISGLDMRGR